MIGSRETEATLDLYNAELVKRERAFSENAHKRKASVEAFLRFQREHPDCLWQMDIEHAEKNSMLDASLTCPAYIPVVGVNLRL